VLVELAKTSVLFDKFILAGAAILDLSKAHMYKMHHDVMKLRVFPEERITMAYMDTDSFTYHIEIPSLTERLLVNKAYFDFSNYPPDHVLYDLTNKGVLGKMKDEVRGEFMTEFCALKAKMYAFVVGGDRESKKAKGVKKSTVRKTLNFRDYVNSLGNEQLIYRTMQSIRSFRQQMHTIEQKKLALSSSDDKRCVLEDGVHTLAWGHCDIPREEDLIHILNH